ncbi:SusC/RagA family TonB-linked outer membrane protein [Pontibacter pamirensis]|uniref:SusC/RagA family TonB-linked outer membrane protein n=1 Tax=Pontibacter pamirensis TaxID=2562824 RepID=UPI00138A3DB8|nr:SusC/RagA family TonB-linked outer membrane protein [Pontibacter pamirensis]
MKKTILLSMLLVVALLQQAMAQSRPVSGQVLDANTNQPLPGVTVLVKGTTVGTATGPEGNFTLSVPEDRNTLVFRYIGYKTVERNIGNSNTVNVQMGLDSEQLSEVVVTALGIEREKKALGYAIQEIAGESVNQARETNVVNALSGKVAGVQIVNSSGAVGSSARITLRGNNSLTGDNQPLFVVDGIPINNSTNANDGYGGVDYGNAASDINPNDIASISVLKGANAAALYGSRAANGVILITTKSGKNAQGLGVTIDHSTTLESPLVLPDYQDEYGQGLNGLFEYVDGAGGGVMDGVDESWGPRLDGSNRTQFFGEGPWEASPNNVRDFFQTGITNNTNVAITGGNEKANARLSLGYIDQEGIIPNTDLTRYSASLNTNMTLSPKLSAAASFNYIQNKSNNRPSNGYSGDNIMQQFIWFGRQVDIDRLRDYRNEDGTQFNWNYNYHNNPYWILYENLNGNQRDRLFGNVSLKYEFTDWLNLMVRGGGDMFAENRKRVWAVETLGFPQGRFYESERFVSETNFDFLFAADRDLSEEISIGATFGGNTRRNNFRMNDVLVRALAVPGIYNVSNAQGNPSPSNFRSERVVNSLYGTATIGFRDYLFLDLTARNDWASTLPIANNSFFYPSVSTSLVFTDAFGIDSDVLSYGKLRASWAQVGNDTDPYRTAGTFFSNDPWDGTPNLSYTNTLANANLQPEQTTSIEVGTDLRFFLDRAYVDFTYYKKRTVDQIVPISTSGASGFTSQVVNVGEIGNEGIELQVGGTPIQTAGGFNWEVIVNFAKNRNEVVSLTEGLDAFQLGSYWGLSLEARPGETYGVFYGTGYLRDDAGNIVVDAVGRPRKDPERRVLGDILPDWTGGIRNSFSYKGFNLSALIDMRKGGDIFSVTHMFGLYAGVLEETLEGREEGIVVPGVKDMEGTTNDINVSSQRYFQSLYGTHEAHIFDGSFVKLREVTLGYELPQSLVSKAKLRGVSISLIGRNLLLLHSNIPHVDPENAFGADIASQGFEFGALPSTRSYGVNLRLTL